MDNADGTNGSNTLSECKARSSEGKYRPSILRQILNGGLGGIIIAGILSVPTTLLNRLLICPPTSVSSWLFGIAAVLASTILGIVLLVMLRPVLRRAAGLDIEKSTSDTELSGTDTDGEGNKRIAAKRSKRHLIIVGGIFVVLTLCGGIVVANLRAVQVYYHSWQMQRTWRQVYSKPLPSNGDGFVCYAGGEALKQYEYHRHRLVELGSLVELHYTFRHLRVPTEESKQFSKLLLSGGCPNHVDFSSPYPNTPEPMQLTIWCWPADVTAWNQFVAVHDVPDYHERFMGKRAITKE